jgi:hypothetical protein
MPQQGWPCIDAVRVFPLVGSYRITSSGRTWYRRYGPLMSPTALALLAAEIHHSCYSK